MKFDIDAYMKRIQEEDAKKEKVDPNLWPCDGCGQLTPSEELEFVETRNGCGWLGCKECREQDAILNEIRILKNGREVWKCVGCGRWFYVKPNRKVDAIGIFGHDENGNHTMTLQCVGCSGGYEAVENFLKGAD